MKRHRILRRMCTTSAGMAAVLLGLLCTGATLNAESYTYTIVQYPGASSTFITGINNSDEVVGYYQTSPIYNNNAFIEQNGVYQTINYPGDYPDAQATAVNNLGLVLARSSSPPADTPHVYSYQGGTFTTLGSYLTSGPQYWVSGLNDVGDLIGGDLLYHNGTPTTVQYPGAQVTGLDGINNAGEVVGNWYTEYTGRGDFIYQNGQITDLPLPAGCVATGAAINNAGQIVGDCIGGLSFFLYSNGEFTVGSWPFLVGYVGGINDQGQIAGSAILDTGSFNPDGTANYVGFIATPASVPDPPSVLLVLSALPAAAAFARRKWSARNSAKELAPHI